MPPGPDRPPLTHGDQASMTAAHHMNGYDLTILAKKGNLYKDEAVPYANCSDGYVNTSPVGSYAPQCFWHLRHDRQCR